MINSFKLESLGHTFLFLYSEPLLHISVSVIHTLSWSVLLPPVTLGFDSLTRPTCKNITSFMLPFDLILSKYVRTYFSSAHNMIMASLGSSVFKTKATWLFLFVSLFLQRLSLYLLHFQMKCSTMFSSVCIPGCDLVL